VREAEAIFDRNTIGPKRYILMYQKYAGLLSGEADKDKDRFLASKPPLKGFKHLLFIFYCPGWVTNPRPFVYFHAFSLTLPLSCSGFPDSKIFTSLKIPILAL
jgi:hypothetical protein